MVNGGSRSWRCVWWMEVDGGSCTIDRTFLPKHPSDGPSRQHVPANTFPPTLSLGYEDERDDDATTSVQPGLCSVTVQAVLRP